MNTQTQEALKMAIEALDFFQTHSEFWKDTAEEAIQACKEALASNSEALAEEREQYDFYAEFDAGVLANE